MTHLTSLNTDHIKIIPNILFSVNNIVLLDMADIDNNILLF